MAGEGFGPGLNVDTLMNIWVKTLAARVDEEAIAALGDLADDPALDRWRGVLLCARNEQAERFRISVWEAPKVRQIRIALRGGPLADLHALASDKVVEPKFEDPCRDALLWDLQPRLEPHGADTRSEGHHAEDNRPDIITVHRGHAVVVEVKRTHSRELWSAIEKQLIAKYLRDPRTDGYGIYLVLWFGPGHVRRAPPSGTRPESPDELRDRLIELLPQEHRHAVTVLVLDVSAPTGRCAGDAMSRYREKRVTPRNHVL